MPKAFPAEFRRDVVAVARRGDLSLNQVAKDFGLSPSCVQRWVKAAERDDGHALAGTSSSARSSNGRAVPPSAAADAEELIELRKRTKLLEQENEILRRAAAYLSRDLLPKYCTRWSQTWPIQRAHASGSPWW